MRAQTRRVLCVEDDRDSCEMLTVMLSLADDPYEVVGVHIADEAKDLIVSQTFDIYILDVWMPDTGGLELCRWIRALGIQTPIMFYAAIGKASDRSEGIEAGADAFLVKPNDLDLIVPTVKQLSERGRVGGAETA